MQERIEINLLPAEYRVHKRRLRLPREIVYPLLVFGMVGLGLFYYSISLGNRISQLQSDITDVENQIERNKPIKKEIQRLQNDRRIVHEKIRALQRISVNKEKWVRLLEILSANLPDWTWLSSVSERSSSPTTSVLDIRGNTFSFPEVAVFIDKLRETEYIRSVDLSTIDQSGGGNDNKNFQFSITASVNPDAGLKGSPYTGGKQ